jgi:hypothetical protein
MRKDITIEKLALVGKNLNISALARQYGSCWRTIDRRLNPDKYKKDKKQRVYKSILYALLWYVANKNSNKICENFVKLLRIYCEDYCKENAIML